MSFSQKSAEVRELLDKLSADAFGRSYTDSLGLQICVSCGESCPPESFVDDLSRKEYQISGFCQKCQDEVFGEED